MVYFSLFFYFLGGPHNESVSAPATPSLVVEKVAKIIRKISLLLPFFLYKSSGLERGGGGFSVASTPC